MMVQELIDSGVFQIINSGDNTDRKITKVYCGDLLSMVMGRAPEGCAWVTVMGNINTLAVLTLTDAACIILAEGVVLDDAAVKKAKDEGITVLSTELPVFEASIAVHEGLNA